MFVSAPITNGQVEFSQNNVGHTFKDGTTVQDTIEALKADPTCLQWVPNIRVVNIGEEGKRRYVTLDNRGLFCFKHQLGSKTLMH